MILKHRGHEPVIHETATVAPNAVICGDVTVGPECRILFGAVITAESGPVSLGSRCIVMENAVLRGTRKHSLSLGDHVLVGPHAHLTGCTVEDNVFLATGATVFNGVHLGARSEVRINGVVHVNSVVAPDTTVPIGWVAVGDPARVFPPQDHDRIWEVQEAMNFPGTVFNTERGVETESVMPKVMSRYTRALAEYRNAEPLP